MNPQSSVIRALRFEDDAATLVLDGAVDCSATSALLAACDQLIDMGVQRLVWDLRDVTMLDSSALGVMVGCTRRLDRCDGRMVITNAGTAPRRMLAVTGLDQVLTVSS